MRELLAALLFAMLLPAHAAVTVRDDLGKPVSFARPPQRIVSLLPSLSESVCALDACARLVAVDDYSNFPEAVRRLPHVGGMEDARVESIVALKPDLVLAPTSSRALPRLQALGLKVMALEPRTLADVRRVLLLLGPVLAARDGAQAWHAIEAELAQVAHSLPAAQRGARVYFEVSSAPYAASEASFIGELLARTGVRNVVPASLGPFPRLNPEFVVRADPDVIMLAEDDANAPLATRPGWRSLRAIRSGRVCRFTRTQADVLVRAGPRLAEGARLMVQCLTNSLRDGGVSR